MRNIRVAIVALLAGLGLSNASCQPAQPTGCQMSADVQRLSWNSGDVHGQELRTAHYRIYTTANNVQLLDCAGGYMEAAYQNYLRLTGLSDRPGERMTMYLMGNREQWAALTASKIGQEIYQSIEAGGYCYEKTCVLWDMGGLGTLSTASHEGLHQFLAYRVKNHLPMWLEEGMCASAEGHEIDRGHVVFTESVNPMRYSDLRAAILGNDWIPLSRLLRMDAGDAISAGSTAKAVGYYGQLWALVAFIRSDERYHAGLQRLMSDAQSGDMGKALDAPPEVMAVLETRGKAYNQMISEPVFKYYISKDLPAFERDYQQFARKLVRLP